MNIPDFSLIFQGRILSDGHVLYKQSGEFLMHKFIYLLELIFILRLATITTTYTYIPCKTLPTKIPLNK
jgi:uncharacterized membrane protein (UPF0127 family)